MLIRACPCGARLVRKPTESQKQYEVRRHCNSQCKGKYHKHPPAKRGFGLVAPRDKNRLRVGTGMQSYLDGRPE